MALTIVKPPSQPSPKEAPQKEDLAPWDDHLPPGGDVMGDMGFSSVVVEASNSKKKDPPKIVISEEKIHPQPKTTQKPATVSVGGAMTLNLGNYESAKVSVHLSLPCDPSEVDATYEKASDWVSARLLKAMAEAKGSPASAAPTTVEHF